MSDNTVAFFIGCVLPIVIFLIASVSSLQKNKLRAQILMKAIETNNVLDTDKLAEALQKPKKTPLEVLNRRLLFGCIFTLIGVICGTLFILVTHKLGSEGAIVSFLATTACLAIGLGFLITYFVTRKQIDIYNSNSKQDNPLGCSNQENGDNLSKTADQTER